MNAIKLNMIIESDTITIPELTQFIGKQVEIILIEDSGPQLKGNISKLRKLKNRIDIDEAAVISLREVSLI